MIWRIVLSFYFLTYITGLTLPPRVMNKNWFNMAACDKDCFSLSDVKKVIIDILEYTKQNPYDIDILIRKFQSDLEREPLFAWYNNNKETDVTKSMHWNQHVDSDDSSQCANAVKQLETAARNAYLHLIKSSCLKQMLPLYEGMLYADLHTKDIDLNINMMMIKILKELERNSKMQKSVKAPITMPKIIAQDWKLTEPIAAEPSPIGNEFILMPEHTEGFHMPEIKPVSLLTSKLQNTLEIPPELMQNALPIMKPENLQLGILSSIIPQQQLQPEVMQVLNNPVSISEVNSAPVVFETNPQNYHKPDNIQDSTIFGANPIAQEIQNPKFIPGLSIPVLSHAVKPTVLTFKIKPKEYHRPETMQDLINSVPPGINPTPTFETHPQLFHRPDIIQDLPMSQPIEIKVQEFQRPKITNDLNIPIPEVIPASVGIEIPQQEFHESEIFNSNQSKSPIFEGEDNREVFPVHDISQTQTIYPNFIAQSMKPTIAPGPILLHPTYVKPTLGEEILSQPSYVNSHMVYAEPQTLNPNTLNLLLQLVKDISSANQINNIETLIIQNRAVFNPKYYQILLKLLQSYKKGLIDSGKINVLFDFILRPEISTLWNDEKRDILLHWLLPDENDQIDINKLDHILSLINSVDQDPYSKYMLDQLLPLLKLYGERQQDRTFIDIILALSRQIKKKTLRPAQIEILVSLIKSNNKDVQDKYIDIIKTLAHWDEISYLNSDYIDVIFSLLKPRADGIINTRVIEIIHEIISLKETNALTLSDIDIIFSFLKLDTVGNVNSKRLDIILFILRNISQAPRLKDVFIKLLGVDVDSKYVDVLLSLNREHILNIQLFEALVTLLKQEKTGHIDNYVLNKVFILLEPYKTKYPKMVNDIFNLLRSSSYPTYQSSPSEFHVDENSIEENLKTLQYHPKNLRIDQDLKDIPLASESHYVREKYNSNEGQSTLASNWPYTISQLMQGEYGNKQDLRAVDKNGYIELTYKLNNEKPLIYKPAYYVKYKIPLKDFMTIISYLNVQNPQITDPVKFLPRLLLEGYMSEVSPNLKGLQKREILASMLKSGDLVQAKVLDESNGNLNEQIKLVHNLNTDLSPEEILQQNNINSNQYYTNIRGISPDTVGSLKNEGIFNYSKLPQSKQILRSW